MWTQNRLIYVWVNIPKQLQGSVGGLLGSPGPTGHDFIAPNGTKMQTCDNQANFNATYAFGALWEVLPPPMVSSCPIDICPFDHPITLPSVLTDTEQSIIDQACAGLTGATYDACALDTYIMGTDGSKAGQVVGGLDTLQNVTIPINASSVNTTATVLWTTDPTYSTYILQFSAVGSQFWSSLSTAQNPLTFSIANGVYQFRIAVSDDHGNVSPWSYSNQITIATTALNITVPDQTVNLTVGATTAGSIFATTSGSTDASSTGASSGVSTIDASTTESLTTDASSTTTPETSTSDITTTAESTTDVSTTVAASTDVSTTDVSTTDVSTTDASTFTDVSTTDISTSTGSMPTTSGSTTGAPAPYCDATTCEHDGTCNETSGYCVCVGNFDYLMNCSTCTTGWYGEDCTIGMCQEGGRGREVRRLRHQRE